MTTNIIVFTENALQHDLEKQLKSIKLQEDYDGNISYTTRIHEAFSLERLDEAIEYTAKKGYNKLIVLVEDAVTSDNLEKAIHSEYSRLFECVEVIPEQFHRRLREATPQAAPVQQQTQQPAQQQPAQTTQQVANKRYAVFPFNPIAASVSKQAVEEFAKTYSPQSNHQVIIYQPQQQKTRFFCMSATTLAATFLSKSLEALDKNAVYVPSAKALTEFIRKQNMVPTQIEIVFPSGEMNTFAAEFTAEGYKVQAMQNNAFQFPKADSSVQLYNKCLELSKELASNKLKENPEAVKNHLTDAAGVSKCQLIVELVAAAEATDKKYVSSTMSASDRDKLWHEYRMHALKQLGVQADLADVFGLLNKSDMGFVTDVVNLAAKAVKTAKDANAKKKEVDSRGLIVSWKDYETLLKMIPAEVLEQQEAKKVAEVNAKKAKTLGEKDNNDE